MMFVACGSSVDDNLVHNDVCDAVLDDGVTFDEGTVVITKAGGGTISVDVEIADAAAERSQGLMCRESVPTGTGMWFAFTSDTTSGFWMKNTYVALDIAYMDSNGVIVDIREMQPCTAPIDSDGHLTGDWPDAPEECVAAIANPSQAYRFTLEVPQGYYASQGVAVGDTATIDQ
ncbi:MAG: DUF192 domain-containing protein [Deltaproteobacteria bacterium]|nr:DUF192 domain-containing protein [Deltaproteobacteria bacterium]